MQIKNVKWVEVHEKYMKNALFTTHDIAIVRLNFDKDPSSNWIGNGLKFVPQYVEPACLPKSKYVLKLHYKLVEYMDHDDNISM